MGLNHHDVAACESAATDPAEDIVQTPDPTAHEGAEHPTGVLIKRLAEQRGHGQDDMAIDDALVEHPADWTDPVIDIDFGTAQAQRRFAAHRDAMGALAPVQTAVLDIAHLVGIPTPEHLVDEAIIVTRLVARIDACKPLPVLDKDLFEDVPVL
jgi:hypothetical protein